ncbi:MAG: hypothetical protein AVDCRST_MAG66-1358, partial [uncultured Pseudonocardia sp.]
WPSSSSPTTRTPSRASPRSWTTTARSRSSCPDRGRRASRWTRRSTRRG